MLRKGENKKMASQMLIPTIIMALLAFILFLVGYYRGEGQHIIGLKAALNMTIQIIPLLIFALIIAGMIQVLLPSAFIAKWLSNESGIRGILIGTFAGALTPGGPFVSLPIAAGLLKAGAGIGTSVAFITAWSLWAIARLPMEVGILGWKFTLIRLSATFIFPPVAGLIADIFFRNVKV